jgi:hypothetical protein
LVGWKVRIRITSQEIRRTKNPAKRGKLILANMCFKYFTKLPAIYMERKIHNLLFCGCGCVCEGAFKGFSSKGMWKENQFLSERQTNNQSFYLSTPQSQAKIQIFSFLTGFLPNIWRASQYDVVFSALLSFLQT